MQSTAPDRIRVEFFDRRVGKSGAVCISGLARGTRVHVAQVRPGIYIVSPLPEAEVRQIVEQMPKPAESQYSALVLELADRKRSSVQTRRRHDFSGIVEELAVPTDAVVARAQLQKPSRPRR